MGWKSLDDMDLNGKRVLTRVDINVPMDNVFSMHPRKSKTTIQDHQRATGMALKM